VTSLLTTEAAYPVATQEAPTAFADVVTAFFRSKRKIAVATLVFFLLVTGIFILRKKSYEARMLFVVRDEASTFSITSFDDRTQSQPVATTPDTQIGTEIELLLGTELHRQVISAMNPGLSSTEMDRRLLDFNKELSVLPIPKTTLISVTYSAPSKEVAIATVATLSRLYLSYRAGIKGSDGAYVFFDQQANRYYQKLQEDQAALANFNQKYQVTSMNEEKDVTVRKLSDARSALYENVASVREAKEKIQTMLSARATLPARVTTQRRALPHQTDEEKLNETFLDLENKRVALLTKYHPSDRHVQEVDEQLANTRAALQAAQQSKSMEEQSDLNPIRQTVDADLQQSKFQSAGLQARQGSLVKQVNEYEAKLGQLNQLTGQYNDLTRKIREDESGYELYFKRREDARINRTLDNDKIANVRQLGSASIAPQSNRQIVLSIASICIIGVLVIVGGGILSDLWSPRFHSPWELESAIGAPVLATIPRMAELGDSTALHRPAGLLGSLGLNATAALRERPAAQMLSHLSRPIGSMHKESSQPVGAYLPLIERMRRINPSEPGAATVFAFTACTSGEGVSYFVRNLGAELTNYTGKRVAIVSAPETYESAMESANPTDAAAWGKTARTGESFLKQWFQKLRESNDYVLIDCPSLSASHAATVFGPQADGLLLVVGSGKATRIQVRGGLAMLSLASVRVIGLALNQRCYPVPDAIYNLL
jgi:uncharacterized protein involved in exopolysaccharide biosynthesis